MPTILNKLPYGSTVSGTVMFQQEKDFEKLDYLRIEKTSEGTLTKT